MKTFKCFFIGGLLTILFLTSNAQGPYPTPEQVEQFKNSTLLVVVDGRDVAFDALAVDAFKKFWKINDFEFIDNDRFNKEKTNSEYSFFITSQIQFEKDTQKHTYHYMYILLPDTSASIDNMPVIAQVPFLGSTLTSSMHLHKTEMLVKFIQNYASEVVFNQGHKRFRKLNYLNKGIKALEDKTLLLTEDQIAENIRGEELFDKAYTSNFKIVSNDELIDAIKKGDDDVVVLHIVAPDEGASSGKCFKMIVEVSTGNAYFYKTHKINQKRLPVFQKSDFRKIRWYPLHWL